MVDARTEVGEEWNHNIHYHGLVLSLVPKDCRLGLDVGFGQATLTAKLAARCEAVTGIDLDESVVSAAKARLSSLSNLTLVVGDVMTFPFRDQRFSFITAVATLHHLPLEESLLRFSDLLEPCGVLVVVGLYRLSGPLDYLCAVAARAASLILRKRKRFVAIEAPMQAPRATLPQIRAAAKLHLPGSHVRRRLLFRYSLVWCKPVPGREPEIAGVGSSWLRS